MARRRVVKAPMTTKDWELLVESMKSWAYEACRSDVDTDHPEGVRVLDKPFNELCAHVETYGPEPESKITPRSPEQHYRWLAYERGLEIDALEESCGKTVAELEARVERLKDALKHYAAAENWHPFEYGGCVEEQIVWLGVYGNQGTFPAGPDLAIVALSELKKEEGDG